jgi:hypothetical protein
MLEGNSADTCTEQFLLMIIGGQAEADLGARNPNGVSGNFLISPYFWLFISILTIRSVIFSIKKKIICTTSLFSISFSVSCLPYVAQRKDPSYRMAEGGVV